MNYFKSTPGRDFVMCANCSVSIRIVYASISSIARLKLFADQATSDRDSSLLASNPCFSIIAMSLQHLEQVDFDSDQVKELVKLMPLTGMTLESSHWVGPEGFVRLRIVRRGRAKRCCETPLL
jgi:hypothetical protein